MHQLEKNFNHLLNALKLKIYNALKLQIYNTLRLQFHSVLSSQRPTGSTKLLFPVLNKKSEY
jgi:hypothetical protein